MKKLLLLLCATFALQMVQAAEIKFEESDFAQALNRAKTENKLIFFDAYTSWCGPCKWMAKNSFTDEAVATYFNSHFINFSADMEKGEGVDLASKYGVQAYPTLIFIDGNGKVAYQTVGARGPADLLKLGQDVVEGKVVSLDQLTEKYNAGERSAAFMTNYIMEMLRAGKDTKDLVGEYKPQMKGEKLLEPGNWEVFKYCFMRSDSEWAQYFLTHLSAFEEKFGKTEAQQKALGFYDYALFEVCQKEDAAGLKQIKADITKMGLEDEKAVLMNVDKSWAVAKGDWKGYAKIVDEFTAMGKNDQFTLNEAAWGFFENVTKKSMLEKALGWANESIKIEKSYANVDTKAQLLHKLGRNDEAIAAAKESIALAQETGEDASETQAALDEWLKK
jgi:thiol-disulfide isomerase/thioredoxin